MVISHLFSQQYGNKYNMHLISCYSNKEIMTLNHAKHIRNMFKTEWYTENIPKIYNTYSKLHADLRYRPGGASLYEEACASSTCRDCPSYLKCKKLKVWAMGSYLHAMEHK